MTGGRIGNVPDRIKIWVLHPFDVRSVLNLSRDKPVGANKVRTIAHRRLRRAHRNKRGSDTERRRQENNRHRHRQDCAHATSCVPYHDAPHLVFRYARWIFHEMTGTQGASRSSFRQNSRGYPGTHTLHSEH